MDPITTLFNFPQLTPGSVLYALKQTPEAALDALAPAVDAARQAANATLDIQLRWEQTKDASRSRGAASKLDNQIDRTIAGLAAVAKANINSLPADHPAHIASKAVLHIAVPQGVAHVTQMRFEDELAAVQRMLKHLDPAAVQAANVEYQVAELARLAPLFEAELSKRVERVDYDSVRAQLAVLQRAVIVFVVQAAARWAAPADSETLNAALAPMLDQVDRIRDARSRRRRVLDVDPESGVEIDPAQ